MLNHSNISSSQSLIKSVHFASIVLELGLATGSPINNFALRMNVKKRDLKPFSNLKKRQKRHRLAEYRQPINEVMSPNNLSDVDQADMLLHYSNMKKNRSNCITPPVDKILIAFF